MSREFLVRTVSLESRSKSLYGRDLRETINKRCWQALDLSNATWRVVGKVTEFVKFLIYKLDFNT